MVYRRYVIRPGAAEASAGAATGARLARRRYLVRLPVPLAARLEALCEMHPGKPRSRLLADLVSLGLAELGRSAARQSTAASDFHSDTSQAIYLLGGPFAEFHGLTAKHHRALERELAGDEPEPASARDPYLLRDPE